MLSLAERGISIKTKEDVAHMRGVADQQFALLILQHNPNLKITYEPDQFEHINGNGKLEGTRPDFYILNPETGRGIYVEITTQIRNGKDPKEKQRRVMREVAPGILYVVLYRNNLENIMRAFPEVDFFGAKRVREREKNGDGLW